MHGLCVNRTLIARSCNELHPFYCTELTSNIFTLDLQTIVRYYVAESKTLEVTNMSNLEEFVQFAESQDEDGTLVPLFLAILEVCFCGNVHGL